MPFNARQAGVAQWTRPRKFFGTINHVSRWVFELGRSTSPRLIAKLFKASLSPRRGFTFGAALVGGTKRPQVRFQYTCQT